jgi:hypothetical protein
MHASTPDQGQDALNELTAASVGLQHVRQARAVVPGALQKEAGRQDFLSFVTLTQTNFGGDDAGGGLRKKIYRDYARREPDAAPRRHVGDWGSGCAPV